MELVVEKLDGAVVFNVHKACTAGPGVCIACADFAVGIHNWLLGTDVRYVIVDLQDEKEVCYLFLEEIMQLRKRLRYPFVFAGVMDKPRQILASYDFLQQVFTAPQDAIAHLRKTVPQVLNVKLDGISFGQSIQVTKPRLGVKGPEEEGVEAEGEDDAEELDA